MKKFTIFLIILGVLFSLLFAGTKIKNLQDENRELQNKLYATKRVNQRLEKQIYAVRRYVYRLENQKEDL